MNYTRAVFLINEHCRAVECTYECHETAERTAFKTFDKNIGIGQFVVVPTDTRHGMTVVKVVAVDIEPDLEATSDMRWIIGVVDCANFEEIKAQEDDAITRIKGAERRRKRKELAETLLADAASEIKALPIASVADPGFDEVEEG